MDGAIQYAAEHMGGATPDNVTDAIYEYLVASRNAGIGLAAGRGTLVWENNAHAGGGAIDLMIVSQTGKLLAITPFDFPGWLSSYDFLETDDHYNVYLAELRTNTVLQDHLKLCGFDPQRFTWENWTLLRGAKRVQYHIGRASGWTFYSMGKRGGEHWHEEPGNRVIDPSNGQLVWVEPQTGEQYPDRGNPGHSLQTFGPQDVAVWGGQTAYEVAKASYGFEAA